MRAGVVLSTGIHVGLLALLLFGLPQAEPYQVEENAAFEVELVPFSDVPTTRLGTRESSEILELASVIETEDQTNTEGQFQGNATRDLNQSPTEDPTNLDVEETIAAPQEADPGPQEEPAPQPVEPEVTEAPAPEPDAAETPTPAAEPEETVTAPEATVAEEVVAEEETAEEVQATPAPDAPTPRARPREIQVAAADFERRRAEQAERDADRNPDAISQAINRQQVSGGGTQSSNQQASLGATTGLQNVSLTQSEEDNLRRQIEPCWSPPIGIADGDQLRVSMRFALNEDGSVANNPQVVRAGASGNAAAARAAASAAQRAILRCAPYSMPPEKYQAWKDVIVNFDPRDLF